MARTATGRGWPGRPQTRGGCGRRDQRRSWLALAERLEDDIHSDLRLPDIDIRLGRAVELLVPCFAHCADQCVGVRRAHDASASSAAAFAFARPLAFGATTAVGL